MGTFTMVPLDEAEIRATFAVIRKVAAEVERESILELLRGMLDGSAGDLALEKAIRTINARNRTP